MWTLINCPAYFVLPVLTLSPRTYICMLSWPQRMATVLHVSKLMKDLILYIFKIELFLLILLTAFPCIFSFTYIKCFYLSRYIDISYMHHDYWIMTANSIHMAFQEMYQSFELPCRRIIHSPNRPIIFTCVCILVSLGV